MKKLLSCSVLLIITFFFSGCSFLNFEKKDEAEIIKQQILEEEKMEEELYMDE